MSGSFPALRFIAASAFSGIGGDSPCTGRVVTIDFGNGLPLLETVGENAFEKFAYGGCSQSWRLTFAGDFPKLTLLAKGAFFGAHRATIAIACTSGDATAVTAAAFTQMDTATGTHNTAGEKLLCAGHRCGANAPCGSNLCDSRCCSAEVAATFLEDGLKCTTDRCGGVAALNPGACYPPLTLLLKSTSPSSAAAAAAVSWTPDDVRLLEWPSIVSKDPKVPYILTAVPKDLLLGAATRAQQHYVNSSSGKTEGVSGDPLPPSAVDPAQLEFDLLWSQTSSSGDQPPPGDYGSYIGLSPPDELVKTGDDNVEGYPGGRRSMQSPAKSALIRRRQGSSQCG